MSATVVLLVIASALAHATWNALLKRSSDPENSIAAMMTAGSAISIAIALGLRVPAPPILGTAWCLVAGLLEAGYFVTLARALSRAPLGSVYTIVRGGALVIVWPVSVIVLGEHVSLGRAAGTVLVVLGLAATGFSERAKTWTRVGEADARWGWVGSPHWLGRSPKTANATKPVADTGKRAPRSQGRGRSGLAVAAFCALFVGGYHLAYKLGLSSGARPEAVNAISLSTGSLLNLAMLGRSRRPLVIAAVRRDGIRILIGGILGSLGFLLFLSAMKNAGAGVVLTLRNTSILFAQVLAFALGERPRRLGIIGAALVVGGAVLLAL
jgi:drug/metabolite transporter (DMT)-like permease